MAEHREGNRIRLPWLGHIERSEKQRNIGSQGTSRPVLRNEMGTGRHHNAEDRPECNATMQRLDARGGRGARRNRAMLAPERPEIWIPVERFKGDEADEHGGQTDSGDA